MALAYLGLGANLGDRLANLREAVRIIDEHTSCEVRARSYIYETDPVGPVEQPDFLNAVIAVETELRPEELLKFAKNIEDRLGRERTIRWGPRVIDVDILLYDDLRMEADGLRIPHPDLALRAFVLAPLADIAPEIEIAPDVTATAALSRVESSGVKRLDTPL
jgi:2-amino-4-hydroxy-6-hydroxymethyldihydropteridine diphosphokinase